MNDEAVIIKTSAKEKAFYALGDFGQNFIWAFMAVFAFSYYTDCVGIAAGVISTMMLVARCLDAISDLIMGALIEKTNTRLGKARPWFMVFVLPSVASYILMMNVPHALSQGGKITYIYITYIFLTVICYTATNLSYHTMSALISADTNDRSKMSSIRTIFTTLAVALIGAVTLPWLNSLGGVKSQHAFTIVAGTYAMVTLVSYILFVMVIKEKSEIRALQKEKQTISLSHDLKVVLSSKYFYMMLLAFVVLYIIMGMQSINTYYVRDVLSNDTALTLQSIATGIVSLIAVFACPAMFRRFGKRNCLLVFAGLMILSSVIMLIIPKSTAIFVIFYTLRWSVYTCTLVAAFTLSPDFVDFTEWERGERVEGFSFCSTSFGIKLGTGIGCALVGKMLQWGFYNEALAVQGESAIHNMILTQGLLPLICAVILLAIFYFWDLDKKMPQVQKELAERRSQI